MIAPRTRIADRPHWITLENPDGPPVPDGEGGTTQPMTPLMPPGLFARIAPATHADLERLAAGTVLASAASIITTPYHPQITTKTRVWFRGRRFDLSGLANPEERNQELELVAVEVVV